MQIFLLLNLAFASYLIIWLFLGSLVCIFVLVLSLWWKEKQDEISLTAGKYTLEAQAIY